MADTNAQKAITSGAGGKLEPAQGLPGRRRRRPRPRVAAPSPKPIEAKTEEIPADGLVVTPPKLAKAIVAGEATMLVKSRPLDVPAGEYVLLSLRRAVGVVKVGERVELTDEQFAQREAEHGISAADREEWAEAQPSWSEGPLWAWPVKLVEKFDEPRATDAEPGAHTVVRGVEVEQVEKIQDVETYDPKDASDAVLRDDFRILLAWYASWKKDPEGFEHGLETIETLLRKVLKELVRRGKDVIQFNPRGMKSSVRQFFLQVARDVKVPEEMFKALGLETGTDPEGLTDAELVAAHWDLHQMYDRERWTQTGVKGWSTEDIVNLHARVVDELLERSKVEHPPPPDNGLDELSADFERNAEKQPAYHKRPTEKAEREYATIHRSGVKRGEKITLADVLPHLKTFKARKPYVYLVGGLANHGETEGDVDILVNDMEDAPDWLKDVIHFRLGRSLPGEIAERLDIHFDRDRGPFTNFVELYDLVLERVNLEDEVKLMAVGEKRSEKDPPNLLRSIEELGAFVRRGTAGA